MVKQTVLNVLDGLPENFSIDEVMYRLYILSNHERAMQDIEDGNVYSTDEVRQILVQKAMVSRWKKLKCIKLKKEIFI